MLNSDFLKKFDFFARPFTFPIKCDLLWSPVWTWNDPEVTRMRRRVLNGQRRHSLFAEVANVKHGCQQQCRQQRSSFCNIKVIFPTEPAQLQSSRFKKKIKKEEESKVFGHGVLWSSVSNVGTEKRVGAESQPGVVGYWCEWLLSSRSRLLQRRIMTFVAYQWRTGRIHVAWPFRRRSHFKRSDTYRIQDHIPKWPGSHLKRSDLCRSDCHEKIRYRSHRGKKIGIGSFQPAVWT